MPTNNGLIPPTSNSGSVSVTPQHVRNIPQMLIIISSIRSNDRHLSSHSIADHVLQEQRTSQPFRPLWLFCAVHDDRIKSSLTAGPSNPFSRYLSKSDNSCPSPLPCTCRHIQNIPRILHSGALPQNGFLLDAGLWTSPFVHTMGLRQMASLRISDPHITSLALVMQRHNHRSA